MKEHQDYKQRLKLIDDQKKSKFLDNILQPVHIQKGHNKLALIKENEENIENKILMSKLQKIF